MLGLLRFLLAYLVAVSHLVGGAYYAHFGFYAVRGFFILSGFLMTSALNDVYRFDGVRFWTNRALRLLPPYLLVSVITLIVITLAPAEAAQYLKFWKAPQLRDILLNLSILPLQFPDPSFRFVPPYWSVAIEIDMYLLLYLVVARRMAWAAIALIASLTYHLACTRLNVPWGAYYFTALSAVLPFSVGALLYFVRKEGLLALTPRAAAIAFSAWLLNMLVGGWIFADSYIFGVGYYLDTILFAIVVAGLVGRRFHPLVHRADKTCGEWAYFIFLIQWLAGFVVASALHLGSSRGWVLFLGAAPVAGLASAAFAMLNRILIEPIRDQVRDLRSIPTSLMSSLPKF